MQTITLYKMESPVLSWGEQKAILAKEYKNRINIIDITHQLDFCIMNISKDDAGKYILKNKDGNIQSIFLLNVWFGPTDIWITPNMSESMNQSSTLEITCSAVCNPDCDFNWVKDQGIRISNSSILFVGNISKVDRGNYKCTAVNVENNNYNISTEIEINVNYAASINLTVPRYKEITEYSSINITCNVSSYPISNISWHSKKKEINTIFREKNRAVLNLSNSTCDDSGMYTCSAFNGIGNKDTKTVTIEILCTPRIVGTFAGHKIKKKVSASIGDEFNMNVKIKAHPRPNLLFMSSDIGINFTTVSHYMYDVMMRKTISSEFDFQETFIIIGNSQGNVTIVIEVEKKKRKFVNQTFDSNSPNNVETGGFRDNILYQSVDSVSFRDQIFDFDNAAVEFDVEDLCASSINRSSNGCFEEDRIKNQGTNSCTEKTKYKGKEDHLNVKLDKNIKTKNTCNTVKGRKPMPRPRTSKTRQEFSKQVPESKKRVFEPEMTKMQSVDSEYSLKKSKYAIHGTQQCSTDVSVKKQGKKSYNSKVEVGQVPEQDEFCMNRNESTKDYTEFWDEQEKCSQDTKQSDFALEQAFESHSIPNDDDPCQFQDYMNI